MRGQIVTALTQLNSDNFVHSSEIASFVRGQVCYFENFTPYLTRHSYVFKMKKRKMRTKRLVVDFWGGLNDVSFPDLSSKVPTPHNPTAP